MTRYGMTLLAAGLVLVVGQDRADDKGDKEKGQGEWMLVSREENGKSEKMTKDKKDYHKLKIKDDNWQVTYSDLSDLPQFGGSFAIDSSKKPKTIDLTYKEFFDGSLVKGLYELDGDTLKVCIGNPLTPDRPAEFKSKDDVVVFTYKRVKK